MFMNVDRIEPGLRSGGGQECPPHTSGGICGFERSSLEDRWILSRFNRATQDVNQSLETYRFDEAANRIYDFFWGEFCDWYLELIKPRLTSEVGTEAREACENLVNLFEAALRLLHPIMPFITEEIWQAVYDGNPPAKSIALAGYPQADENQVDLAAETEMAIVQDLIVSVRNLRAELKVEPRVKVPIEVFSHDPQTWSLIHNNRQAIERLGNVQSVTEVTQLQARQAPARGTARFDLRVVYDKKIDITAERERLIKELEKIEKEIANGQRQLANEQFLAKAPAQVVEGIRKRAQELEILREKTGGKLKELG